MCQPQWRARAPLRPTPGTAPRRHGARRRAAHRHRDPRDRGARRPHARRRADRRPRRPAADGRAAPLPDPFAWDPEREDEFVRARRGRHQPPALRALARRRGARPRSGSRAGARRSRRAAQRGGRRPRHARGRSCSSRAPGAPTRSPSDTEGAVGLTQILAETGQNLLGMQVDVAAQRAADARRIDRERLRGHDAEVAALAARARRGRRALRPREGARRRPARYLKLAQRRASAARTSRFVSYHMGIGQPRRACCAPTARTTRPGRSVYFDSTPARHAARLRAARLVRRRLLELLLEGARRGARDHAPVPRGPRASSRGCTALQTRQGLRRGGAAPARLDAALRRPRRAARGVGRRRDRRVPRGRQR